jgi:hypothetical protein
MRSGADVGSGLETNRTEAQSPFRRLLQQACRMYLIGSIRRECVDQIIVLGEAYLRRILKSYARYYNGDAHALGLGLGCALSRIVKGAGRILCRPVLGGLHHENFRTQFPCAN